MRNAHPDLLLIELPTFPKGTIALSLFAVAASLKNHFNVRYVDVNLHEPDLFLAELGKHLGSPSVAGLKVSAQNFSFAKKLSAKIREVSPQTKLLWGGEFPTLLQDECLPHCDTLVTGQIESIARQLSHDFSNDSLQKVYHGKTPASLEFSWAPDFSIAPNIGDYFNFMGLPLETSRGCVQKCVFCMVHVMQKGYILKSQEQIDKELEGYKRRFVNVIDYNIGVDAEHVIKVADAMKRADVAGWMAEMCLESLDNDEMLKAMQESGCRMIYCGLESIDEISLLSVNKANTNHIENYERIIRKVQGYGIQIAAGVILGIKGTNEYTFEKTYRFFHRMGIIYTKLTFLTYNPGTKVNSSMEKMGEYPTRQYEYFDGNHLSYVPKDVSKEVVYKGADWYIRKFYHPLNIFFRSFNVKLGFWSRIEYILFSYCFGEVYRQWLKERIFYDEAGFNRLLMRPHKKSLAIKLSEKILARIRQSKNSSTQNTSAAETTDADKIPDKLRVAHVHPQKKF